MTQIHYWRTEVPEGVGLSLEITTGLMVDVTDEVSQLRDAVKTLKNEGIEAERRIIKLLDEESFTEVFIAELASALEHTEDRLWRAIDRKSFRDGPHLRSRNEVLLKRVAELGLDKS